MKTTTQVATVWMEHDSIASYYDDLGARDQRAIDAADWPKGVTPAGFDDPAWVAACDRAERAWYGEDNAPYSGGVSLCHISLGGGM